MVTFTLPFKMRPATSRELFVCELPAKPQWCEIRNTVFGRTRTRFPFHTQSARKLNACSNSRRHTYQHGVFRCWSFSQRSKIKPEKPSSGLRSMGDSSGHEAVI